jgi:hypothetical protein
MHVVRNVGVKTAGQMFSKVAILYGNLSNLADGFEILIGRWMLFARLISR